MSMFFLFAASLVAQNNPPQISVTHPDGSNWVQTFSFQLTDLDGANTIVSAMALVDNPLSAGNSCYIYAAFIPSGAYLYLADNSGSFGGSVVTGTSGVQQNSQCVLYAAGSSVVQSGTTLTWNVALSFKSGYTGNQNLWATVYDGTISTIWASYGTFTVTAPPHPGFQR
jgi:hypothetical protein